LPRFQQNGAPAASANKRKLSELFIRKLKPRSGAYLVWDEYQRGLAISVQPTGHISWKTIYSFHGRPRWFHIGDASAIGLADARRLAGRVMFRVAEGHDPCAERRAERSKGTFEELATRYVEQHAKRRNKSWKQADALVRSHLIPRWGKLNAADITRTDVKVMMANIVAPVVANQVLASASAIFGWALREDIVKLNPCTLIERNKTTSRERVLADSEIPRFWNSFETAGMLESAALKMILLTGQRPGEVSHMRREHIEGGWWNLPGEPVPTLGWPGTKNGENHRVWLPAPALAVLAEMEGTEFVFAKANGRAVDRLDVTMRAICKELGAARATPHDLRRTHGTTITSLGFGRDAMNRIQNHREGGIASVYDRHQYAAENKQIMEAVAARIGALAEGKDCGNNIITGRFGDAANV
jgi:integrase